MMRWLTIAMVAIGLQGCALFSGWKNEKPVIIEKKAADRTPLNLPMPAPLKPTSPQWIVITPENAERVWAELKKRNVDLVLFALTDDGYEELSVDAANIRNFIATQREIIIKYREYYEPQGEKK
jgi:hypothetical protein